MNVCHLLPRWMLYTLVVLLIIFITLLNMAQLSSFKRQAQIMNIVASGKASAVPDLATVTVGVVSEGLNQLEVKNQNNQKINQMLNFFKQQGIDSKDIQTSAFYVSPKYNYANGQNNIVGYQANQAVTLKIRGIDKSTAQLEKIIDGAMTNGANQIQGISFSLIDEDRLAQLARKQAIQKAKQKAEEVTTEAGLHLGRVINIIPSESHPVVPRPYAMANLAARGGSVTPDIEPGNQEVVETVTLVFEVN